MKMRWAFAALFALCSVLGFGPAKAAEPSKIKVGILLPLTGTVRGGGGNPETGRAAGDRRRQQAGRAQHALGQGDGGRRCRRRRSQAGCRRPALPLHGFRRRQGRGRADLGAAGLRDQRHRIKEPMPYFPVCVMAKEAFRRASSPIPPSPPPTARGRSATWPATRRSRRSARSRSSSWPAPTAGAGTSGTALYAAAKEFGAKIVGYDEVSLGTSDFTTILQKVRAAKPDVFISAQFAADCRGAPQAGPPDGPGQGDDHLQRLHHQRGRQRPAAGGAAGRLRDALFLLRPERLPGQGSGQERARVHRTVPREIQHAARCLRGHRLHRLHGDVPRLRGGQVASIRKRCRRL